jgi:predicted RNase H-like HicB family nuclease
MTHYVGILDGAKDVWGVRVPDLPGCFGGGASPEAAIRDAVSAMREWSAAISGKGRHVPPPRSVALVTADPETEFAPSAGESIVMLPLLFESGRGAAPQSMVGRG